MKKTIHLSIEKELVSYLKSRRLNISKYVEKLVAKDIAVRQSPAERPFPDSGQALLISAIA
jgi:post-segregation antitoxin (ccd killing protein)